MRTDFETLIIERPEPHILVVTLNRPDQRNALNTQMGLDMVELFGALYVDQEDVRCIVLTGSGSKAFCAGGDLKQRNNMTDESWQNQHAVFEKMTMALMDCPVPIIAAVNGAAYGGGLEMALSADFVYAARSARFAQTETRLGIMPGAGGTQNLPRACGVVNKICDDESLMEETMVTARRIAANAPIALRQAKKSIGMATQTDLKTG